MGLNQGLHRVCVCFGCTRESYGFCIRVNVFKKKLLVMQGSQVRLVLTSRLKKSSLYKPKPHSPAQYVCMVCQSVKDIFYIYTT